MADSRARHAEHELELVAAYAAGEATDTDLERAERLLDACDLCVGVARDLRAITLSLQELPAVEAMGAYPPAPRDFRLTPEQASRLRPSAPLVRWTARLVAAVAAFGKPVGASLATLGLVGLLVGAASLGSIGPSAGSSTAAPIAADANATAAPAPGTEEGGAAGAGPAATAAGAVPAATVAAATRASATSSDGLTAFGLASGAPAPSADVPGDNAQQAPSPGPGPAVWLLALSFAAVVGGLALVLVATRRG